jgi:catechol 2,3-dioxygenase-like lactoylglutathione lyase family enzyme
MSSGTHQRSFARAFARAMTRTVLSFSALLLPSVVLAQTTPVVRLQNLAHAVTSLDETLPLYRDAFGFTVNGDPLSRQPQPLNEPMSKFTGTSGMSFRAATFKIPNAEFGFELTEFTGGAREAEAANVQDVGAAMLVLRVRDVGAMLAKARAAGATVVSSGGGPVGSAVVLRDPDGFFVELQQPATLPADASGDIIGASINLSVADADKSVEFLSKAIGFDARPASAVTSNPTVLKLIGLESAEWRIAHGHIPGTTADFGLIEYRGLPRARFSPGAKNPGSPAFTMVVVDVASATDRWVKSGGVVASTGGKPIVQPNGAGNVFVKDVDGFTWELIQRAPQ